MFSVEQIKAMGKEHSESNLLNLIKIFKLPAPVEIRREIVSSIGRQDDNDRIFIFMEREAFNSENPMELIYQIFRTCLYKSKNDSRFSALRREIINFYKNENINKMNEFYDFRQQRKNIQAHNKITRPMLLAGDNSETLKELPDNCVQLAFTSPPYYNAREYSDYKSYSEYLEKMKKVFIACNRVIEEGRFFIVNVSPVITKRAGREFESIRYPIHYDFHKILVEAGFYFIDEIIWIKPEPSVPDRVSGYKQTRKPLSYKPNCITESIMVYRKNCNFLLDKNMKNYTEYDRHEDEEIDTSNCWFIAPKYDKNHPAVFPEELCKRILKYYSFEGDAVLDPFAGSGTLGRVARKMNRIPIMCEINDDYIDIIDREEPSYYDVHGRSNKTYSQQINLWQRL
ncbi:MAG: site-specific DNA-methyltransferase [Synergistaceae bacterium]|nr:site-specific DNA-methyltransferase [Synergistaceae bacterium]